MIASELTAGDWTSLGARVVGATFLWTAFIKAVDPLTFSRHLYRLGWIPQNLNRPSVIAAATLEAALGMSLIVMLAPGIVLPVTLALLIVLSFVSWWGVRSGKASDCGCYGGFIQPSIGQSLALNALFFVLVAAAWALGERTIGAAAWQIAASAGVAVIAGVLATAALEWPRRKGKPLFDLNPVKVGRRWSHRWAGGATAAMKGEFLVAWLGPKCPFCVQFVRVGNAMVQSDQLPDVFGVVAASKEDRDSFVEERQIRFPVTTISDSLMSRIADAVPTVAVVEDGIVTAHWVGAMPPEFAKRFTTAFFPQARAMSESAGSGRGTELAS